MLNVACGDVYVSGRGWKNIDFIPQGDAVDRVDILGGLPFSDGNFEVVYSSHFLEHVPYEHVESFLLDCARVLRTGGVIRLVLPDFQEQCRSYLSCREAGEAERADYMVTEIVDQFVRNRRGGRLSEFYAKIAKKERNGGEWTSFIMDRCGEDLDIPGGTREKFSLSRIQPRKIINKIFFLWNFFVSYLLTPNFRKQNVSFADPGERHLWAWDFSQVKVMLEKIGFVDVQRCSASTSSISDFPLLTLDLNTTGSPRKGAQSMYIEAVKQ